MDGVLGDVELALDSFGDDAIEQVDEEVSENTESELHPPPGALRTLFKKIFPLIHYCLNTKSRMGLQIVEMKVFLIKFQIITPYELFT